MKIWEQVKRLAGEYWACESGDIGGIIGGIIGGDAAGDAADAQAAAAAQQVKAQQQMYGQTRSDQMPWLSTGGAAVNQLGYLMGLYPGTPPTASQFNINGQAPGNWGMQPGQAGYAAGGMGGAAGVGGALGAGVTLKRGQEGGRRVYKTPQGNVTVQADGRVTGGSPAAKAYYLDSLKASAAGGAGGAGGMGAYGENAAGYPGGGFGSLAKPFGMDDYQADPGYAFRLSEGSKALERSQAARGGLLSGAAGKAMLGYGQGMGAQEYGAAYDRYNQNQSNLYNRLAGLSGTGQTAAGTLGSAGASAAQGIGQGYGNYGDARAGGAMGQAAGWQTGLSSLFGGGTANQFGIGGNSWGGQYGGGQTDTGGPFGTINWY